jgi:hypothetical protein
MNLQMMKNIADLILELIAIYEFISKIALARNKDDND